MIDNPTGNRIVAYVAAFFIKETRQHGINYNPTTAEVNLTMTTDNTTASLVITQQHRSS